MVAVGLEHLYQHVSAIRIILLVLTFYAHTAVRVLVLGVGICFGVALAVFELVTIFVVAPGISSQYKSGIASVLNLLSTSSVLWHPVVAWERRPLCSHLDRVGKAKPRHAHCWRLF